MSINNPFFKKNAPISIFKIISNIKSKNSNIKNKYVNDIKEINVANKNDITFLHSSKYSNLAGKTKASYCLTTQKLKDNLPVNKKGQKIAFKLAIISPKNNQAKNPCV